MMKKSGLGILAAFAAVSVATADAADVPDICRMPLYDGVAARTMTLADVDQSCQLSFGRALQLSKPASPARKPAVTMEKPEAAVVVTRPAQIINADRLWMIGAFR